MQKHPMINLLLCLTKSQSFQSTIFFLSPIASGNTEEMFMKPISCKNENETRDIFLKKNFSILWYKLQTTTSPRGKAVKAMQFSTNMQESVSNGGR